MRLYTKDLVKKYKARTVVNHVSIEVNQGEIVGLLGPNGAGKTTSFYMIVGLIKPNGGRIFLENDNSEVSELTDLPVYRRAQMGVGYLAQEASVFRNLSVEDNIRGVLEMTRFSKEYQRERCEALIEEFRLQKVRKSFGNQLSGGERRRTEIARAVAINPAFILLDEPFAGVDPIAVEDIQSIVATLKEKNIGVIITDHNVDETLAITDRAYLLYEGKVLMTGTPEDLAADPEVRKRYLGQHFELRRSPKIDQLRREAAERHRAEGGAPQGRERPVRNRRDDNHGHDAVRFRNTGHPHTALLEELCPAGAGRIAPLSGANHPAQPRILRRHAGRHAVHRGAGASLRRTDASTLEIDGGLNPRSDRLRVGESGLSARLFTPIAALCDRPVVIDGEARCSNAPCR